MPTPTDINKELQKRIDRYISKTLKDIKVEAADEFDANFNRQAFFNEKWARRKYNDDESRGLLVQSGTLRRSITAKVTDRASVLFQTTVPYARIHNAGGTITVTSRMKKYFWWKYITIVGSKRPKAGTATTYSERFQRKKNGELRNNRRNRELTEEAKFYKYYLRQKDSARIPALQAACSPTPTRISSMQVKRQKKRWRNL